MADGIWRHLGVTSLSGKCFRLERFFLLVVLGSGVMLLFIASGLVQQTQYIISDDFTRLYLQQRDLSGQDGGGEGEALTTTTKSATSLPIDPPWMASRVFLDSENSSFSSSSSSSSSTNASDSVTWTHPFLPGYVIESSHVCSYVRSVDLLIIVHSAVRNFQRRRVLRETWAARDVVEGLTVRRIFALGRDRGVNATHTQLQVATEAATYGDVVQGDFDDTFSNLTLKALTALRWVHTHCRQTRFVLKADDDMLVNVFVLAERLLDQLAGNTRTIMCQAKTNAGSNIIFRGSGRWAVPDHLLPKVTHWPAFCSGYVIVMTSDVASQLYLASFSAPYSVPVDDAFVYGVLPLIAGGLEDMRDKGPQRPVLSPLTPQPLQPKNPDKQAKTKSVVKNSNIRPELRNAQQLIKHDKDQVSVDDKNHILVNGKKPPTFDISSLGTAFEHGKSILRLVDIRANLTVTKKKLLEQYTDLKYPVTLVAGQIDDDADLLTTWRAVMARLSPWGQYRSSLATLQRNIPPKVL